MKCKIRAIPGTVQKLEIVVSREIVYSILNLSHILWLITYYKVDTGVHAQDFKDVPLKIGKKIIATFANLNLIIV